MGNWFSTDPARPDWTQLAGINLRRVGAVLLIGGLLAAGGWLGRHQLRDWYHGHLLSQARKFQEQKDTRSAVLEVAQVLGANPSHRQATLMMAEMAEAHGSPAAVFWRGRAAELEPGDASWLALANVAMRFNETMRARVALEKVSPAGQQAAGYKRVRLSVAVLQNQRVLAEQLMREIARLEPPSAANDLNLALLQVALPQTNLLETAVRELGRLRTNPVTHLGALRGLYLARQRQGDSNLLLAAATELAAGPAGTMQDRLQLLDVEMRQRAPAFPDHLTALLKSVTNSIDVFTVESWMSGHGLARMAGAWIEGLPADLRLLPPVPMALAESLVVQESWTMLEELTRDAQWPVHDFMRLAMLSRALRAREDYSQSRKAWQAAVDSAGRDAFRLGLLAKAATAWKWDAEAESVWWLLAESPADPLAALETLKRIYAVRGNTRQLLRVARRGLELSPDDRLLKNNTAMYQLLLYEDIPAGTRLAKENFEAEPENPFYVSTYAFALVVGKHPAEARALMQKLPARTLELPVIATYYGVVLAAAGDKAAAPGYLAKADKVRLLPEEKLLVADSRRLAR